MKVPADKLLAELIIKHKHAIWKIHDHDSLLEHQVDQEISGNIANGDYPIIHSLKLDGAIGQGEICNSLKSENF